MPHDRPAPHDRPMPHDRPAPGYLSTLDDRASPGSLALCGYRPMPAERPADCLPLPDYLAVPDYPPLPDHAPISYDPISEDRPPTPDGPAAGHPLSLGSLPVPEYPAVPGYLAVRASPPAPRSLAAYRLAGRGAPGLTAALSYLTVPLPMVPLVIYLTTLRAPGWARRHAAQAVNVWCTGLLYDLSAVIMGAMLALDSPRAALTVFGSLVVLRWLITLRYLARAAAAASQGAEYSFPAWLCMRIAR